MKEQIKVPWNGWEITKTLGTGSFGSVYEIKRDVLGTVTKAAMKVISVPRDTSDLNDLISIGYDKESINSRFLDELKGIANEYNMMNQLKGNANIIYCEDLFYEEKPDGFGYDLYIRMELLEPIIKALPNPVTEAQVIKLGLDMCNALSACRKHKIIHRDIKPSNILLSSGGDFKLGDFGVSKTSERTAGGTKTGTYGFMAPEVYNNKPYNASVDIYSLGMVLYWMLNRRCGPFLPLPPTIPMAKQIDEAKQRRFSGEAIPEPVDGSSEIKAIVLKACAFDPNDRFLSPEEFAAELEKLRNSDSSNKSEINAAVLEKTETENVEDERTIGNNWGFTDEPTQGTQYGGEEIEQGGTVGGSISKLNTNTAEISKDGQPIDLNADNTKDDILLKSLYEGRITEVLVSAGDKVRKGDLIARVNSNHVIYDIPSHRDGYVDHVFIRPGYSVKNGLMLATITNSSKNTNGASSGSGFDVLKTLVLNEEEAANGVYKKIEVEGKKLELHIPAGVVDCGTLCYDGQGKTDPETGAKGNLIIRINVKAEDKKNDFWDGAENESDTDQYDDEIVIRPYVANLGGNYYTIKRNRVDLPKGVKDGDIINRVKVHIHDPYIWKTHPEKLKQKDLKILESLPSAVLESEYLYSVFAHSDISKYTTTAIVCLLISIICAIAHRQTTLLLFFFISLGCGIVSLCKLPKYIKSKRNARLIRDTSRGILRARGKII